MTPDVEEEASIFSFINKLACKNVVHMKHVRGHAKIALNEAADRAADRGRAQQSALVYLRTPEENRCHAKPISMKAAKKMFQDEVLSERIKRLEKSISPYVDFFLHTAGSNPKKLKSINLPREFVRTALQLQTGFSRDILPSDSNCHKIGAEPICHRCDEGATLDVEHYLCHCPGTSTARLLVYGPVTPKIGVLRDVEKTASFVAKVKQDDEEKESLPSPLDH
jgi:hypothetical protein